MANIYYIGDIDKNEIDQNRGLKLVIFEKIAGESFERRLTDIKWNTIIGQLNDDSEKFHWYNVGGLKTSARNLKMMIGVN